MASQGAEEAASNHPITIPELLKILPRRETALQIRMGNYPYPAATSHTAFSGNNNINTNNNNNNSNHNNNSNNRNNTNNSSSKNQQSNGPCFHTLRYGFKPASVNSEEPAILELTQAGHVTIKAPNVAGSKSKNTVFRGQRRPHVKECLLIIDHDTGEMVLQKLTDNITVKATRSMDGNPGSVVSNGSSSINNNISVSNNNTSSTSGSLPITTTNTKNDGPQLSEESSSSSDSDSSSRSRSSSSSSSSSSSNSGNSSPNTDGFTF